MPSMFPGRTSASQESRAQITIEAIIVMGIFTLIFVSLINLTFERLHLANEVGSAGEGKMYGLMIASALNNAYSNGDGFIIKLDENRINFSYLQDIGISLPIKINTTAGAVVIEKKTSLMGGDVWSVEIAIIPRNITRSNPTADYPEVTIRNSGGEITVYADSNHIQVVS